MNNRHVKVLVIGGGPAGATTAALLAKAGIETLLLERDQFPRYHIGESLLVSCLPTLKLSGAYDAVAAQGFQIKRGALFFWADDEFSLNWDRLLHPDAWSWQVDRAEYDEILLRNAARQGAEVIEGASVRKVLFEGSRPVAAEVIYKDEPSANHTISFDYLVDASGRSGVLSQQHFKSRETHEVFQNVALWGYWEGATQLPGTPEGGIAVISVPDGWWWSIPLSGNRWSVGLVLHKNRFAEEKRRHGSLEAFYHARVHAQDRIKQITSSAIFVEQVRAEQDYSYVATSFSGPNHRIVGDAACFIDPLLSTGVHLAQYSAVLAAASIGASIRAEATEVEAAAFFEFTYRRAYTRLLVLVSRLYQSYRGKDDYFWNSQALVREEVRQADAKRTFTDLIAGMTDMRELNLGGYRDLNQNLMAEAQDAQDAQAAAAREAPEGGLPLDMSPAMGAWQGLVDEDNKFGDLRLVTEPVLGLSRTEELR